MEETLNNVYKQCNDRDKSIGPLKIHVITEGTFNKLMDYAINQSVSINQYKVSQCVRPSPIIKLLDAKVQGNYFSLRNEQWNNTDDVIIKPMTPCRLCS
jgi:auxin responsive GH3 gene family